MSDYTSNQHIERLGERLERARLLRNIPQTELAHQAGISARTLRRLESGEGGSMDSFIRVLMALDLDGNLTVLIPDHTVRPMERVRPAKTERQRARRPKNSGAAGTASTAGKNRRSSTIKPRSKARWTWGDEQS